MTRAHIAAPDPFAPEPEASAPLATHPAPGYDARAAAGRIGNFPVALYADKHHP